MELSPILAEFWGIILIVSCGGLLFNKKLYENIVNAAQNEEFMFLYGLIALIIGAFSVSLYNIWALNFEGLITLFGWATLLKGIVVFVFPQVSITWLNKFKEKSTLIHACTVLFLLLGIYLLYIGLTS